MEGNRKIDARGNKAIQLNSSKTPVSTEFLTSEECFLPSIKRIGQCQEMLRKYEYQKDPFTWILSGLKQRRRKQSCTTWFNPVSAYHLKPCFKSHRRSRLMISFWETQQATFWEAQQTYYMHCADVHCDWSLSEQDSHLDPPPRASSEFLCTCGPSSERLLPHVSTLADIMSRGNAS